MTQNQFVVREWRPFVSDSLRGLSLELPSSGLVLHGLAVYEEEDGARWVGLLGKEVSSKSGIRTWAPLVEIEYASIEARGKFQSAALAAIDSHLAAGKDTAV